MTERLDIVARTRAWIGTPYVHQASSKGAGTDCLGLLRGLWREIYGKEPEMIPAYSMDWSEPQGDEVLWRAAQKHLFEKPCHAMSVGDVLLFRMRTGSVAKHLGIVTGLETSASFVHAYTRYGVVESALSEPWRRRIAACFAFPEEKF